MSSESFIDGLKCLKMSNPINARLSLFEKDYIMKQRKEQYKQLLLENLNYISDSDIIKFKVCLESEIISFQEILDELNNSSSIVVPTCHDSLVIEKDQNYRMTCIELNSDKSREKQVEEYISELIPERTNWKVDKSYYNNEKKKFEIRVSNPCQQVCFTTSI